MIPSAILLLLAAPSAALAQVPSGADRLPLLWMWLLAAALLLAAFGWLLFGPALRARRRGHAPPPPRP